MANDPPLQHLLAAVERSGRRLSPREHVELRRWLREAPPGDWDTLRVGLASTLARDAEEWTLIAELVERHRAGAVTAEGESLALAPTPDEAAPTPRARRWRDGPGPLAVAVLAWFAVGALIVSAFRPEPHISIPVVEVPVVVPETSEVQIEYIPMPLEPARTLTMEPVQRTPKHREFWRFTLALAAGMLLATLGHRWRHLGAEAQAAQEKLAAGDANRRRQEQRRLELGTDPEPLYGFPLAPPLSAAALAESADRLGQHRRWSGTQRLDVGRTVSRTAQRGGRLAPVFQARGLPAPFLVLIDEGVRGGHPWLHRCQALVEAWRALGVPLIVGTFHGGHVDPVWMGGLPRSIEDLARRTGDLPLILLSPELDPFDFGRVQPWVGRLSAWGRQVWIDPDPLAIQHRGPEIEALAGVGLRRFPFSDKGVVAAATAVVGVGRPAEARDPTLPDGEDREEALWRWALAAVLVPKPTWAHLESLRVAFDELRPALPGPHAVRWLLEWVKKQPEARGKAISDDGAQLHLPKALQQRLLQQLEERATREPDVEAFRQRALEHLDTQLGRAHPKDPLSRLIWTLRKSLIQLRLGEKRAAELLQPLLGSAYHAEVVEIFQREAARSSARAWSAGDREAVAQAGWSRRALGLADLLRGARHTWPHPGHLALWSLGLGLGSWTALEAAEASRPVEVAQAELPATFELRPRRVWPGTGLRPDMVEILPGRFQMGSPEDEERRDADEIQHEVVITRRFAIARTEVTQAMYAAVMGENPSVAEYKGVSLLGDELPVQNVSWVDAVRFCNALSEREGLTPAYAIQGEQVTWNRDAEGYRLPTEAEWAYAARAGRQEMYGETSSSDEICRYANARDSAAGQEFGWESLAPCDDGVAGLAPAGTYEPSAWALHDMGGNVSEWTWDWFQDLPEDLQQDPEGPSAGSGRVIRGGSWSSRPVNARVAYRRWGSPSVRGYVLGFRPARSLPSAL
ncbi:MAG: SUMF1/EgtB/PvdO family nonheme iron enzyme [Alphaproteobacteria bacterium]|nr:SUMF1/EgtB/PvdO family nonheme iron enzyme [Alphaproteobacteria bacterium]